MKDINLSIVIDELEKEKIINGLLKFYEIKISRKKTGRGTPYVIEEKSEDGWVLLEDDFLHSLEFQKNLNLYIVKNSWEQKVFYKCSAIEFAKKTEAFSSNNEKFSPCIITNDKFEWVVEYFNDGGKWFIKSENMFFTNK